MERLRKDIDSAVIAAALSLMLGAAVQTMLLFVGRVTALPDFIRLSVITLSAMLVPVFITHSPKNRTVFPDNKLSAGKSVLFIIFGFAVCTALNFLISLLRSFISAGSSASSLSDNGNITGLLLLLFSAGILPAVLEEILFRGKIMPLLMEGGNGFAVIVSAMLFAFIHNGIFNMLFAFTAGLVIGFIRSETKRLVPCIIVHLLNNALALLLMFSGSSGGAENSKILFYITGVASIIIAGALLPFVLKLSSKDNLRLTKAPFLMLFRSPVFYILIVSAVIMQLF